MKFRFPYQLKLFIEIQKFFGFLLLFCCSVCNAQSLEQWNKGFLVTADKDTLFGEISINLTKEFAQFKTETGVQILNPEQISMIYVQDSEQDLKRYFYSFLYNPYSEYKKPKLFEMLFSGKAVCLLGRESMISEAVPVFDTFTNRTYYINQNRMVTEFFFLLNDEKVQRFQGAKRELKYIFPKFYTDLRSYIKQKKLDLGSKTGMKDLTEYCNSLSVKK